MLPGRQNSKVLTNFPASNTSAVITAAGSSPGADRRWRVRQILASYSAAPTAGRLLVQSGAGTTADALATILDLDLILGGPAYVPLGENGVSVLKGGHDLVITLFAGGAGIVGKLNAHVYPE